MQKLIAIAAFLALVIPGTRGADDAAKAVKLLEGTYEVLSATRGGKPDEKAKDVESFTFKDGTIAIKVKEGGKDLNATFKLDPSKKPAQIDLMPDNGGGKDETIKGIYESKETDKGLELSIAFARDGGDRPKDFKGEGENEIAVKLLRKK